MFKKLLATTDDFTLTFMRLILGIVFFPHGAQKLLGWFGGYGFSGTMGFLHHADAHSRAARVSRDLRGVFRQFGTYLWIPDAHRRLRHRHEHARRRAHGAHDIAFFMNWTGNQKGEGYEYHLLALALATPIIIRGAGAISIDRALSSKQLRSGAKASARLIRSRAKRIAFHPIELSDSAITANLIAHPAHGPNQRVVIPRVHFSAQIIDVNVHHVRHRIEI